MKHHRTTGSLRAPEDANAYSERRDTHSSGTHARSRVLVVDDSRLAILTMQAEFMNAGFQFVVAADASEAMRTVFSLRPDVIISDIFMPGTNGIELVRTLRNLPGLGHARFFLMTSTWSAEHRIAARSAGVEACLQKPVDSSRVVELLRKPPGNDTLFI